MSKQIKSWQECVTDTTLLTDYPDLMQAEIKELRAALATPPVASGALPELTLDKINEIAAKHIKDVCGIERKSEPMGEDHEFVIMCRAIAAAAAPNAALVGALTALLGLIDEFGIRSGVCCCGDGMARHDNPMDCGHSPVDSGEYYSEKPIEFARAALAQAEQVVK